MSKYIVQYRPTNNLHTRYIQGVKFIIGENEVHPSKYPAIAKDPTFVRLRASGVFVDVFADENAVAVMPEAVQPVADIVVPSKRTAKKEVEAEVK